MTEDRPHIDDRPTQEAALTACRECPWRQSNRGREHPETRYYTDENLTRTWRAASQDGMPSGCHMFCEVPWKDEWTEAGYKKPAAIGRNRECAGMVGMIQREYQEARKYPNWEAYHAARPTGLSRKAMKIVHARLTGQLQPPLRFSETLLDEGLLDPAELVNTSSPAWLFDDVQADDIFRTAQALFPALREHDCTFCNRHEEVHPAVELTAAEGITVRVDAALHPLLSALATAGIRTTDSCQDFRGGAEKLIPHELPGLLNPTRGTLNYETVLRRREAFIRLRNDNDAEKAFITAAEKLDGVTVETVSLLTQTVFPLDQADELAGLAT